MFSSKQEQAIFNLTKTVLGSQHLFSPLNYGHPQNEPADLAWVSGRCAVLMYMTSSKRRSFDHKRQHNLSQMYRWVEHWKNGQDLNGISKGKNISIGYNDVDQIIVLSVVGGKNTGSMYEYKSIDADNKILACVTISDRLFELLSKFSVGLCDVISIIGLVEKAVSKIEDNKVSDLVEDWISAQYDEVLDTFPEKVDGLSRISESWPEIRSGFFAATEHKDADDLVNSVWTDLSFKDVLWINVAEKYLWKKLDRFNLIRMNSASISLRSNNYSIQVVVVRDSESLKFIDKSKLLDHHLSYICIKEVIPGALMRMSTLNKYEVKKKKYLQMLEEHYNSIIK